MNFYGIINILGGQADISQTIREVVEEALYPALRSVFGINVTDGFLTGVLVTILLLFAALLIRIFAIPKFKTEGVTTKLQMLLESAVTFFDKSASDSAHKHASFLGPYIFTTAIFIALTTLFELFGLRPTFSTINACLAFGISAFVVINICGLRQHGIGSRIKRVLNPINIITDLSVPLSLTLRLFGSVTSGFIIMEVLYSMLATSFVIPAAASVVTTLFHALIQAYLFATLTSVFVGEAVELKEHKN